MTKFAIGQAGQPPRLFVSASVAEDIIANIQDHEVCFAVDDDAASGDWQISDDGQSLKVREAPLEEVKDALWQRTKRIRSKAMALGCWTPRGRIDTDQLSLSLLTLHIAASTNDPFFKVDLTMLDNSIVSHSREDLRAAFAEVGKFVQAVHARSMAIRGAIDAARSVEDLANINVTEDWPEIDKPQ